MGLATVGGWTAAALMPEGRFLVARNLQRIAGGDLGRWQLRRRSWQ